MVDPCWARVCGPLEPYAEGLRGELERLGYTPLSAAGHVRLVAHLSRWMIQEGLSISALAPATVDAYFAQRLTDRLHQQRQASPHTIATYRDAIRLLVVYAAD